MVTQYVARVLNDLRHRVEHEDLRVPGRGSIAQRVDDRHRVEDGLQHDFPDVTHVAETHEQGAEEERERKGEDHELDEERHQPEDVGTHVDSAQHQEEDDDHHAERKGDQGRGGDDMTTT